MSKIVTFANGNPLDAADLNKLSPLIASDTSGLPASGSSDLYADRLAVAAHKLYIDAGGTGSWKLMLPFVSAASAAERDAYFGTPNRALQDSGAMCYRSDTGRIERYFDTYNASTNPFGATPAGWYAPAWEAPTEIPLTLATGRTQISSLALPRLFAQGKRRWFTPGVVGTSAALTGSSMPVFNALAAADRPQLQTRNGALWNNNTAPVLLDLGTDGSVNFIWFSSTTLAAGSYGMFPSFEWVVP